MGESSGHRVELGARVPRIGNRFLVGLGRGVLALYGWRMDIRLPDEPRCMIIAAPHTSNWDFVFGLAGILGAGLHVHWYAKHTLFQGWWGGFFRALGGMPVNRGAPGGVVAQAAALYRDNPQFMIGLAPEGTRKRVTGLKRGFYHIAAAAQVPVITAYIDYRRKQVGTGPMFRPTGDWESDMRPVLEFYRGIGARKPENFAVEL